MNNEPLVSVIMPAYNDREAFLRESIESILNQTYQNLELIIADDSTEKISRDIIDEYAATDSRIRIVRSPERMGVCKALNKAIAEAKGEFIAHMDADDVSMPNRLECQIPLFTTSTIAVVGGQVDIINENSEQTGSISQITCSEEEIKKSFSLGQPQISNPTSIVRRSVFVELGGYEELYRCSEDYDFWYRVATFGYSFVNTNEVVLHYRIHSSNAHTRLAQIQSKLCCMTLLKYGASYSQRLNSNLYNLLENFVRKDFFCKLYLKQKDQNSHFSRIIKKLRIEKYISRMIIKTIIMRGKKVKRFFE